MSSYEKNIALAEAYASSYVDARSKLKELDLETSVWSAVKAGYLKALYEIKADLGPGIEWVISWTKAGELDSPIWKRVTENIKGEATRRGIEIFGLSKRMSELQKDRERLEWLASNGASVIFLFSEAEFVVRFYDGTESSHRETFRKAVDAAMRGEK